MKRDIPQIHLIRVLATLGILLHHFWNGQGVARAAWAGSPLDDAFQALALGVVVFNVMTAFLITLPFVGPQPAPPPGPLAFFKKRLARISPQYLICLALFTVLSALIFHLTDPWGVLWSFVMRLAFLQTFSAQAFMSNIAAYWWLGLLVQFSLAFPWLLRLMLHPRVGPLRLTVVSCLVVWPLIELVKAYGRANPGAPAETFAFLFTFNLPARLPEFAFGMAAAASWRANPDRPWPLDRGLTVLLALGLAVSLVCAAIFGLPTPHLTGAVWCFLAFAGALALPMPGRLATSTTLLWLSAVSYSVYLVHQPILSYCGKFLDPLPPWPRFWAVLAAALALSFIGARAVDRLAAVLDRMTSRPAPRPEPSHGR